MLIIVFKSLCQSKKKLSCDVAPTFICLTVMFEYGQFFLSQTWTNEGSTQVKYRNTLFPKVVAVSLLQTNDNVNINRLSHSHSNNPYRG